MVFRNLRERFGIDDQDYQVRGVFEESGGLGGHRTRRESPILVSVFLSVLSRSSPVVSPLVPAGSWRGRGPEVLSASEGTGRLRLLSLGGAAKAASSQPDIPV